jgi:hypothetical protein
MQPRLLHLKQILQIKQMSQIKPLRVIRQQIRPLLIIRQLSKRAIKVQVNRCQPSHSVAFRSFCDPWIWSSSQRVSWWQVTWQAPKR